MSETRAPYNAGEQPRDDNRIVIHNWVVACELTIEALQEFHSRFSYWNYIRECGEKIPQSELDAALNKLRQVGLSEWLDAIGPIVLSKTLCEIEQ